MLEAAGIFIPEALNKFGANCGPEAVWFKTGALLLDGNTLNYFGKPIPIVIAAVLGPLRSSYASVSVNGKEATSE
ncbi:hypothetical protein K2173_003705 [Erythroxylum novogranatense]|uniref:Chlorophyll a-b binding protein, chloroplastic n=1 Tax=Erythroxylum novogranatense TaxID=1862640 RepID=A0AAV8TCT4_9ROSI|nr:hypothetical protein K2173_003705 [Erythroxylum novogranatense]